MVGVSTLTIKRWESDGNIPKAKRAKNNWRMYSELEVEEIKKFSKELKGTSKNAIITTTKTHPIF